MHGILLAAALAASDGDLVASCAYPQTECVVNLTKGRDYDFHLPESDGDVQAQLVTPAGDVVIDQETPGDGNGDAEFRAAYDGPYRLRLVPRFDPTAQASIEIYTDCRSDAATDCWLTRAAAGSDTGSYDVDAYRAYLRAGVLYAFTFDRGYGSVDCGDHHLQNHKGEIDFRPPATGVCLLKIARTAGPYRLGLTPSALRQSRPR